MEPVVALNIWNIWGEMHEADLFEKRLELNKGNPLETMPEAVGQTANKKSLQTESYLLLC